MLSISQERRQSVSNPYRMTDNGYGVASFKNGGAFLFDEIDRPLIERHT